MIVETLYISSGHPVDFACRLANYHTGFENSPVIYSLAVHRATAMRTHTIIGYTVIFNKLRLSVFSHRFFVSLAC